MRDGRSLLLGSFALPMLLLFPAEAQAPSAGDLRTESRVAPLALDTPLPRFSWKVQDPDRGAAQSAYRVLVASSAALLGQNVGDLWDSGQAASDDSVRIPYGGAPLASDTRYHWKVRLWDEGGLMGPWSPPATFDTGLQPSDWQAEYVWDGSEGPNDVCYLRREVVLASLPVRAIAYVTAHDDYVLWVNGQRVGEGPPQADPYDGMRYDAWDLLPYLQAGANAIAVRAHFHGGGAVCGVLGEPAFRFQASIRPPAGAPWTLVSDSSWRVLADTPYDESAPLRGPAFAVATGVEDFDARDEPSGWRSPGFDDSTWSPATVAQPDPAFLPRAAMVPPRTTLMELPPVSITQPVSGVYVVDFGENRAGYPVLSIHAPPPGTRVQVWYSEELVGGRIVRDRDRITDYWDAYTCRGDAVEQFRPDIKYQGFRYIEVEGYPGALDPGDVAMRVVGPAQERAGNFSCSIPLLESIHDISVRSMEGCVQDALTDCPTREQTQYAADAYLQALNLFQLWRDGNLTRKFLLDIRDSDVGLLILSSNHPSQGFSLIPEWSMFWVMAVWEHHLHLDDPELLAELYPNVVMTILFFEQWRDAESGLFELLPAFPFGGIDVSGNQKTVQNALYCETLRRAADIARELDYSWTADDWDARADEVAAAIHDELFNGTDRYLDSTGSNQSGAFSNALPLCFGITPPVHRKAVLDHLEGMGFQPPEPVGAHYLVELFLQRGMGDEALALLDRTDAGWGALVAQGATTTWEDWQGDYSLNHAWGATPIALFARGILGVRPNEPGYRTFDVRPVTGGDLEWAEGTVPTVRGDVHVRWELFPRGIDLDVTVPPNTTARVQIPVEGLLGLRVRESGTLLYAESNFLGGVPGVEFEGVSEGRLSLLVGGGSYSFRARRSPLVRERPGLTR